MEYLSNAFFWDHLFTKTFWKLISRPGLLTKEYLSGKFISQEHPLKLNMFLLFVFITLFFFFASDTKMTSSIHNITKDERVFADVQLSTLAKDAEYSKKMESSPRDTILLRAPLFLAENHPQLISSIEVKEDTNGEALDKWVAVLPRILIEDKIVTVDDSGYYRFNQETEHKENGLDLLYMVGAEMVRITSQYFPLILLLTAPFLSFSLNLVQRRSRLPRINHFIFALHYTAFLETLMICIFLLHLTIAPPRQLLESILILGSCIYLAIAFRRVYENHSWVKAIVKSLLTSLIYFFILLIIFIVIFFIACVIIADQIV
jgi:hypothetical protein